jgi:hypothetical protein
MHDPSVLRSYTFISVVGANLHDPMRKNREDSKMVQKTKTDVTKQRWSQVLTRSRETHEGVVLLVNFQVGERRDDNLLSQKKTSPRLSQSIGSVHTLLI